MGVYSVVAEGVQWVVCDLMLYCQCPKILVCVCVCVCVLGFELRASTLSHSTSPFLVIFFVVVV
jgi:hypothetical protein